MLLNKYFKRNLVHFTDKFGNVNYFMNYLQRKKDFNQVFEIMVHPAYEGNVLIDFLENTNLEEKLTCLKEQYNIKLLK